MVLVKAWRIRDELELRDDALQISDFSPQDDDGDARRRLIPRLPGRRKQLAGLVVQALNGMGEPLMKERKRPAIGGFKGLEGVTCPPQQPLPHAESNRRRGAAVWSALEFPNRVSQIAIGLGVGAERLDDRLDLDGAKRAVASDKIADIQGGGSCHRWWVSRNRQTRIK